MDNNTIFTKTAKGSGEVAGKSKALTRDDRAILKEVDGQSSVQALAERIGLSDAHVRQRLASLAAADFIRSFVSPDDAPDAELDFTRLPVQNDPLTALTIGAFMRETERQAQQAAEDRVSREAEQETLAQQAQRESEELARRKASVARIRQEALEKYRRDLAEQARQEAEEQQRREAEEQARRAAQEQARREAEEQARREAEERARQEAAALARKRAEEQARREAEEQARREAEEEMRLLAERRHQEDEQRARRKAEQRAEQEAKEQARREAKALARKEAAERARRKAEEEAQRAQLARREAHEKALRDAQEQAAAVDAAIAAHESKPPTVWLLTGTAEGGEARDAGTAGVPPPAGLALFAGQPEPAANMAPAPEPVLLAANRTRHYRPPSRWAGRLGLALAAALVAGVMLTQVMPFEERRTELERQASARIGQPVRVGKVRLAWLPVPHWRLADVTIGKDEQIRIAQIDAIARLDTLFSEQAVYRSVTLQSPVVNEEGLGWLLFDRAWQGGAGIESIHAVQARLDSPRIALPAFDIDTRIGRDGKWSAMTLDSAGHGIRINLKPNGGVLQVDLQAQTLGTAFGNGLPLAQINAMGRATRDEMRLSTVAATLLGGFVTGNARLTWGTHWTFDGAWKAQQIDAARLAPALFESGRLEGEGEVRLEARTANELFSAPRITGNAGVRNGVLLGVNLADVLRAGDGRGKTSFSELGGSFVHDRGTLQLRNLRLDAGLLSASGRADVDDAGGLKGRFAIDIRASSRQVRGHAGLGGTLAQPRFQ